MGCEIDLNMAIISIARVIEKLKERNKAMLNLGEYHSPLGPGYIVIRPDQENKI